VVARERLRDQRPTTSGTKAWNLENTLGRVAAARYQPQLGPRCRTSKGLVTRANHGMNQGAKIKNAKGASDQDQPQRKTNAGNFKNARSLATRTNHWPGRKTTMTNHSKNQGGHIESYGAGDQDQPKLEPGRGTLRTSKVPASSINPGGSQCGEPRKRPGGGTTTRTDHSGHQCGELRKRLGANDQDKPCQRINGGHAQIRTTRAHTTRQTKAREGPRTNARSDPHAHDKARQSTRRTAKERKERATRTRQGTPRHAKGHKRTQGATRTHTTRHARSRECPRRNARSDPHAHDTDPHVHDKARHSTHPITKTIKEP
jgi:hypothetical protein